MLIVIDIHSPVYIKMCIKNLKNHIEVMLPSKIKNGKDTYCTTTDALPN